MPSWPVRVLIAALATVWPAPALGQGVDAPAPIDMIETMNRVCVASQGDRSRTETLALEAGYSPVPQSMLPRVRNADNATGFMRSNAVDMAFVITGTMNRRVARKSVTIDFCGVSARPTDHDALDKRLGEVMGFEPVKGRGFEAYAWVQTPEGSVPTRSLTDPEFLAMAATGQMRMVGLDREGPGSTLIYFRPRID